MRATTIIFIVGSLIALGRAAAAPLPRPTGPHALGTEIYYLTSDAAASDHSLVIQAWYPTAGKARGPFAPYLTDWELAARLTENGYYFQSPERLADWARMETHSRLAAIPLTVEAGLPVILFAPGLGVVRANYTSLAEDLASHGYAVFLVEPPQPGAVRLAAGYLADDPPAADGSGESAAEDSEEEPDWPAVESEWAADLRFTLDWLNDPTLPWHHRLDLSRVGAAGHSLGGAAAFEACRLDSRFRACVNLDGLSFGLAVKEGVERPALFLKSQPRYSDQEIEARGLTRETWDQRGEEMRPMAQGPIANSSGPGYYVEFLGTGHMSFSDAPWVMPDTITHFGGDLLSMGQSHEILTATLRGFLAEYLARESGAFERVLKAIPELKVSLTVPQRARPTQ